MPAGGARPRRDAAGREHFHDIGWRHRGWIIHQQQATCRWIGLDSGYSADLGELQPLVLNGAGVAFQSR